MDINGISKFFEDTEKIILFINEKNELVWSNKYKEAESIMYSFVNRPIVNKIGMVEILGKYHSYEILRTEDSDFYIVVADNENAVQKLISNPQLSAEIRGNITSLVENLQGILGINTVISDFLEKSELFDETKYLNKSTDKIFKILNLLMNLSELVKYSVEEGFEGIDNIAYVNISWLLGDMFEKIDRIILGQNFSFGTDFVPNLYANINQDKFIGCVISMIMYAIKASKNFEEIRVALTEYDEVQVVFSIEYALKSAFDLRKEPIIGSERQVIEVFCKRYGCVFNEITSNDFQKLELIVPVNENSTGEVVFRNTNFSPFDDKFSRLHIAFSEFTEYKIF
ncbi:MAG: hypothetical protein LBL93_00425 [Ruminococcus sp.]|jgi:hypothetical protein|nr:hypothetical protein [Ruminococcus sp.]